MKSNEIKKFLAVSQFIFKQLHLVIKSKKPFPFLSFYYLRIFK